MSSIVEEAEDGLNVLGGYVGQQFYFDDCLVPVGENPTVGAFLTLKD